MSDCLVNGRRLKVDTGYLNSMMKSWRAWQFTGDSHHPVILVFYILLYYIEIAADCFRLTRKQFSVLDTMTPSSVKGAVTFPIILEGRWKETFMRHTFPKHSSILTIRKRTFKTG